ncbi:sensor histidine kinase [Sporolactobacillus shoreicorticis]|uniref:histidine kinase n=1 Tax=Sporolactobacillus shoreicorticis TaxID=1923877 RepID=A0ABW5S5B4_9BACL|nr:sensor histidine kinase [Sporolactobacillus shoreicorticis]MCO7126234.1 sensor histidine kinase [Sporolactobacillus shoreicorticis]
MKLFPKATGPYPYLWLLIIFPQFFIIVSYADHRLEQVIGLIAGIGLIYIFRQMYWLEYTVLLIHFLLAITILAALSVTLNSETMLFFLIGFVFLFGYIERVRDLVIGIVGLAAAFLFVAQILDGNLLAFVSHDQFFFLLIEIAIPIAIFSHNRTRNLHDQLAQANEQIVALVKEQERGRFARDLHDTLGHTLTMIILKSELALRLIEKDTNRAKSEIGEIEQISRSALNQTRELVASTRHHSLAEELNETKHFLETKGISVTIHKPETWPQLRIDDETMLSLAFLEGITNVVRHSNARKCAIRAVTDDHKLFLEINDDGIGICGKDSKGNGLHTMRERMRLIGGTVTLDLQTKDKGTRLCFSLPLNEKKVGKEK